MSEYHMKKPIIISIIVAAAIVASLSLLFLEDKEIELIFPKASQVESVGVQNATANLLEKDNIKAMAMLTRSDASGKLMSKEITELYLTNGLAEAKVEIMYDPKDPTSFNVINNVSKVLESMLRGYEPQEIGVVLIGIENSTEILIEANNFNNLQKIRWYGIDAAP